MDNQALTDDQINGWWDIARVGKWKGSMGGEPKEIELTIQDLEDMARDYGPQIQEAPVTVEHIKEGPAFGWVESLRVAGDMLQARFKSLAETMRDWLRTGAYRSRSIEFYKNPIPTPTGRAYLRAVTFLGAASPAVKGLSPTPQMFSENALVLGCQTMELSEAPNYEGETTMDDKSIKEKILDPIKDYFTRENPLTAQLAEAQQNIAGLTEKVGKLNSAIADLGGKLKAETSRADTAEAKLSEHGKTAELSAFSEAISKAQTESRLTPAEGDVFLKLGQNQDKAGREKILELVAAKNANGLLTEHSAKEKKGAAAASKAAREEARFKGFPEDPEHKAACELQAADPDLKFEEAIKQVRQEKEKQTA